MISDDFQPNITVQCTATTAAAANLPYNDCPNQIVKQKVKQQQQQQQCDLLSLYLLFWY